MGTRASGAADTARYAVSVRFCGSALRGRLGGSPASRRSARRERAYVASRQRSVRCALRALLPQVVLDCSSRDVPLSGTAPRGTEVAAHHVPAGGVGVEADKDSGLGETDLVLHLVAQSTASPATRVEARGVPSRVFSLANGRHTNKERNVSGAGWVGSNHGKNPVVGGEYLTSRPRISSVLICSKNMASRAALFGIPGENGKVTVSL